jgi:hypothetical protein
VTIGDRECPLPQRSATAPASTPRQLTVVFDDEVGTVFDELRVEPMIARLAQRDAFGS